MTLHEYMRRHRPSYDYYKTDSYRAFQRIHGAKRRDQWYRSNVHDIAWDAICAEHSEYARLSMMSIAVQLKYRPWIAAELAPEVLAAARKCKVP